MPDEAPVRVLQQLAQTYRSLQAAFDTQVGQSMPRWRILLAMHEQGSLPQKTLVARLGTNPAAVTRQLKALEQQGLIIRTRNTTDNRLIDVTLSAAGRALVRRTLPRRAEFMRHALDCLSATERADLSQVLQRLDAQLRSLV